jgi:hypothetical protein
VSDCAAIENWREEMANFGRRPALAVPIDGADLLRDGAYATRLAKVANLRYEVLKGTSPRGTLSGG